MTSRTTRSRRSEGDEAGIRINLNPLTDLPTGLAFDRKQEDQAIQELSTGKKVNKPSDNPAAVAGLVVNNAQLGSRWGGTGPRAAKPPGAVTGILTPDSCPLPTVVRSAFEGNL